MARNTIVEFSEGHTMNRSDTRLLKSIITTQEDQFRAPYGMDIVFHPRHCVFAITTNQNTYLRDETGNRRFLPVVVKNPADIVWLTDNLSQLYAEAYKRAVVDNETTWEFPEEETKAI
jgi:predicted P-loop ATPase